MDAAPSTVTSEQRGKTHAAVLPPRILPWLPTELANKMESNGFGATAE